MKEMILHLHGFALELKEDGQAMLRPFRNGNPWVELEDLPFRSAIECTRLEGNQGTKMSFDSRSEVAVKGWLIDHGIEFSLV
jgi:hypothetical protein